MTTLVNRCSSKGQDLINPNQLPGVCQQRKIINVATDDVDDDDDDNDDDDDDDEDDDDDDDDDDNADADYAMTTPWL